MASLKSEIHMVNMYIPYFLTKNQQTRRFSFAEHLEELISMVDHGPTAAGPMLGIRFRQEVSVDNKATCTSFGDENIFKAGGIGDFLLCAFEEYLYGLKRRRRGFDVERERSVHTWQKKSSWARSGSENLALTTLNMNCLLCPWPNHKPWGEVES